MKRTLFMKRTTLFFLFFYFFCFWLKKHILKDKDQIVTIIADAKIIKVMTSGRKVN